MIKPPPRNREPPVPKPGDRATSPYNAGQDIASGTYFARLIVDDEVEIKSLTLMR